MSFGSDDDQNPFARPDINRNPYAAPSTANMEYAQPSAGGFALATRGERFAGALLDGIILFPLVFGAGFMLGFALLAFGMKPDGAAFNVIATVLGGVLGALIFLIINGYFLASRGQTVGKIAVKTQIVSDSTNTILPLGLLVLKRYVPIWIITSLPFVGGFFALGNALAIFRENRKCIHDDIAGTKVIKLSH